MQNNNKLPTQDEQRNLFVAFLLSVIVLAVFYIFFGETSMPAQKETGQVIEQENMAQNQNSLAADKKVVEKRLPIDTERLMGSLNLIGNRFDDIFLKEYKTTLNGEDDVHLLAPSGADKPYFIEFGWVSEDKNVMVPDQNAYWRVVNGQSSLSMDKPLVTRWDNGQGVTFERTFSMDDYYGLTVEQRIINKSGKDITLYPYGLISKTRYPMEQDAVDQRAAAVMHQGIVAYLGDELHEIDYDDLEDEEPIKIKSSEAGWAGIVDKYWLVSMALSDQETQKTQTRFAHQFLGMDEDDEDAGNVYQIDHVGQIVTIPSGTETFATQRFFMGAKRLSVLNHYEEKWNIPSFDLAIDFGWFYIITKPFYLLMSFFGQLFAEMGVAAPFGIAILMVTVLVRGLTFPLQHKAYTSMSKMRILAPKMQELKAKFGDNKERLQKELMELYQKEDINPASGCFPMLIQIPIFFALYKVLYISIEMRHAPFYGWIHDLSAQDSTSIFTLFGLIPIDLPGFLVIGAWPALYAVTLILQQRMSPPPTEETQRIAMTIMPIFFTYLFSRLPAGLVIYFVWSNVIGIVQNAIIQYQMGHKPKLYLKNPHKKVQKKTTVSKKKK